jgi:acyl-CoA thioester hydrolase
VWHGNYVKYLEKGRCALLNKIGYGYAAMRDSGYVFPVTEVSLKYIKPLHFGERVRIRSVLDEYENRIKIKYELYNAAGELATRGVSTQMAVDMLKGESCFVCPPVFIDKVEAMIRGEDR